MNEVLVQCTVCRKTFDLKNPENVFLYQDALDKLNCDCTYVEQLDLQLTTRNQVNTTNQPSAEDIHTWYRNFPKVHRPNYSTVIHFRLKTNRIIEGTMGMQFSIVEAGINLEKMVQVWKTHGICTIMHSEVPSVWSKVPMKDIESITLFGTKAKEIYHDKEC